MWRWYEESWCININRVNGTLIFAVESGPSWWFCRQVTESRGVGQEVEHTLPHNAEPKFGARISL